ncbi:diacylglycerol/lipid kinase family protein [Nocardioides marmoribigeumensis]|uniref:Diacylglycerol kinase (ATP) n=1 Tax=Nocardioides marmoribigeumensis TaxID=433649 RepID=A0ABU2BPP8_9ACTN|nr:diacylglycerol kinase family protein [Nocardioides marmoribigeumensis]MDR7360622.1 diacylglycerol kinase (ATP) [Nocardioides marmoribigeumensis]
MRTLGGTTFRDCLVVANPAAGSIQDDTASRVATAVARSGALEGPLRLVRTEGPGHAAALAAGDPAELVVAIGGDGTVSEVTQVLAGTDRTLCALPAGSGNSTARALWGDRSCDEVTDLLRHGRTRTWRIDLLRLAELDAVSVLGTSTGFLAQVLADAAAYDGVLSGIDRYYAAAAGLLSDMPDSPTRVSVDGAVLSDGPTSSVAIGGGRHRARAFEFLPRSVLDDGLLDVSTIEHLTGEATERVAATIPTGDHLDLPGVTYARGREVVVERTDGHPLVAEHDGTVVDVGPRLTASVMPAALTVLTVLDRPRP